MARYYYSTQPFLAWCLNHYFYDGAHFAWVGAPFYPYKLVNPRSSSPLRIYEDLYEPWKDQDEFSSVIAGKRISLGNRVALNATMLSLSLESQLKNICDQVDVLFFYPVVYRVNIDTINKTRLIVAGSGLVGSHEYLIESLQEAEFDILFGDFNIENLFRDLIDLRDGSLSQDDALDILEKWLV